MTFGSLLLLPAETCVDNILFPNLGPTFTVVIYSGNLVVLLRMQSVFTIVSYGRKIVTTFGHALNVSNLRLDVKKQP